MKTASIFGAFNARWLEPEDVARSFVPTQPFKSLVSYQHSLLMGPRGCGKTTLLKMLTRRAQRVWQTERVPMEPAWSNYRRPEFEAIYIPSDVRWSSELESVQRDLPSSAVDAERVQRALVSISSVIEATKVFESMIQEHGLDSVELLKAIITHIELGPTVPLFREIRLRLLGWVDDIHSALVRRDAVFISDYLDQLPSPMTAHSASAITKACSIFDECMPSISPSRWALCFDELEIAPHWLQKELFMSMRSFDQRFLLKLTWSPVLPADLMPDQERQHDYAAIRMWHGHVTDARPFCKEFSTRFLRDRLGSATVTPKEVFGPSPFAQEESDSDDTYGRGTSMWHAMVRLAQRDPSFKEYLSQHGISPDDPVAESVALRDESLRKVKPIVLLREAYLRDTSDRVERRSRKNPPLYFGEDAIYAMSEGNPRLLAGLLNELLEIESRGGTGGAPLLRPESQSRVLHAASQRMLTGIKSYPVSRVLRGISLSGLVQRLGQFLKGELVGQHFTADPVGSFFIDEDVRSSTLEEISIGLLIGSFVHVKSPEVDIPSSVVGSRVRLSYMLAPSFQLLFRNYRETRLSTALRIQHSSQRLMFGLDERK